MFARLPTPAADPLPLSVRPCIPVALRHSAAVAPTAIDPSTKRTGRVAHACVLGLIQVVSANKVLAHNSKTGPAKSHIENEGSGPAERPMTIDLTVLSAGAFLVLMALIWTVYRVIDGRLSEIQTDIGDLHTGVSRLFLLASKSEAETVSENAGKVAHKANDLALLQSPGLEADLAVVDGLCAKLITLAPPAKAAPLISEKKAERPTQFEGRKLIQAWPTSAERSRPAGTK
jgi:hypothetical protein